MPTQISCGATDCEHNTRGQKPQCGNDVIRVNPGQMGGAICFHYTNAPFGQKALMEGRTRSQQGLGGVALQGIAGIR